MPTQSGTSRNQAATTGNEPLAALFAVVFGLALTMWVGAQLAALTGPQHRFMHVGLFRGMPASLEAFKHASNPRTAWLPEGAILPGPVLYWTCTAIAFAVIMAVFVVGFRLVRRLPVGSAERKVLSVDPKARLATRADMAPLFIRRPEPGRLLLGRVHGRLVATELRRTHMPDVWPPPDLTPQTPEPVPPEPAAVAPFGSQDSGVS